MLRRFDLIPGNVFTVPVQKAQIRKVGLCNDPKGKIPVRIDAGKDPIFCLLFIAVQDEIREGKKQLFLSGSPLSCALLTKEE